MFEAAIPDTAGASRLSHMLRAAGFADWFEATTGVDFLRDPWRAFDNAQRWRGNAPEDLALLVALFVHGDEIGLDAARQVLGTEGLAWLAAQGIVAPSTTKVRSQACLLAHGLHFLFADWPLRTASGRIICQRTYLSSGSYDCAERIRERSPQGRALDLGCGGGILTATLTRTCLDTTAIDIDPRALWLTRINLALNGAAARALQADWDNFLPTTSRFDFVVANPPWRIVPSGLRYPDVTARVGTGTDGLDQVRQVLGVVASVLAPGGEAILRFDLPWGTQGAHPLQNSINALRRAGKRVDFVSLDSIPVDEQAQISANTCAHLNEDVTDLTDRFAMDYAVRGISRLESVLCVVRT